MLVKSGFLPPSIKSVEQAVAVALKGFELGLPIMTSYSHINIIQGKPTISAELMLALIYRDCQGCVITFVKIEDDCCILEAARPGGKPHTFKYDTTDAKYAGLLNRSQWKQYPRAMFRSRCVSEMARTLFPDAIMGCSYTPEELSPDLPPYMGDSIPHPVDSISSLAPAPPTEVLTPNRKVFDSSSAAHVRHLKKMMRSKGVKEDGWDAVIAKMEGKPSDELDNVLSVYYNELFAAKGSEDKKEEVKMPSVDDIDLDDIPFDPTHSKLGEDSNVQQDSDDRKSVQSDDAQDS